MQKEVSIAEARQSLPAFVHMVETSHAIHLTRRGKQVAVLLSLAEYQRLQGRQPLGLWDAISAFQASRTADSDSLCDEDFEGLRDRTSERDFEW
ncbi:type II toxin-antitoxin system Phd/YefM family antitoxin [bacterium]|nr:type II toxin-antitoxin system Phd/YefM family antitoxin [bacterium]